MEIELGYFTLRTDAEENTFLTPQIVVNYGFAQNLELVGEAGVEKPPDADLQLVDPGLFLKAVVKEGLLQEKEGVSVAVELGSLLPSTRPEERRLGFEGIGIVSHRVSPFTFHLNAGGGVDREGTRPFAIWGLITELPVVPQWRLVGEVNGKVSRASSQ